MCFSCYHWNLYLLFNMYIILKYPNSLLFSCLLHNIARLNFLEQYLVYNVIAFKSLQWIPFSLRINFITLSHSTSIFQAVIMHYASTYYLYIFYHRLFKSFHIMLCIYFSDLHILTYAFLLPEVLTLPPPCHLWLMKFFLLFKGPSNCHLFCKMLPHLNCFSYHYIPVALAAVLEPAASTSP